MGRSPKLVRTALAVLLATLPASLAAQLPRWVVGPGARPVLEDLWRESVAARAERVACLGGAIGPDTVRITSAEPLEPERADSLHAHAAASIARCGPPRWIGTAHTHVRSTDDPEPVGRFSPGDRAVMSEWSRRWGRAGAFCVLYSPKAAHCEVYPSARPARVVPAPDTEGDPALRAAFPSPSRS